MRKFLAVVKHEYKKIVYKWTFLLGTLLFPIIAAGFAIVPAIIFSLKGEPTRIAIVDPTGKIAPRIKNNLSPERIAAKAERAAKDSMKDLNASQEEKMKRQSEQLGESFIFTDYSPDEKSPEQIRRELNAKIIDKELDAYLIIPENIESSDAKFEFFSRKAGDFITKETLEAAVNEAVRSQRLADAEISEAKLKELSRNVAFEEKKIDERGDEKDTDGALIAAFIIGTMIY